MKRASLLSKRVHPVSGVRLAMLCFTITLTSLCPKAGAQGTYNANSCSYSDVNAVVNGPTHKAVNGDIIQIPAGTCTWTTTLTVSGVGITIMGSGTQNSLPSQFGAGTVNTVITHNIAGSVLIKVTNIPYGQTFRISTLNIKPNSGSATNALFGGLSLVGSCTAAGCPNIRVDNVIFDPSWDTSSAEVASGGLILADNVFGVLDHNTATGTGSIGPAFLQAGLSSYLGIGGYGDNSWAQPDTYGTARAIYEENNLWSGVRGMENDVAAQGGSLGGVRVVCRFNSVPQIATSGVCTGHGTSWAGRYRGPRQVEVYNNTVAVSYLADTGTGENGGTELVFNNSWNGYWNKYVQVDVQRDWHSIPPFRYCDGAQPYDTNDGTVYASGTVTTSGTTNFSDSTKSWTANQWSPSGAPYSVHNVTQNFGGAIFGNTASQYGFSGNFFYQTWAAGNSYQILRASACIDQPGRGQGALLQSTTPVLASTGNPGPVDQVLDPVYEWGDTHSGSGSPVPITSASPRLLKNRDYYNENMNQSAQTSPTSPFDGSSGVGHGTLANRPPTCTAGVAYWATNEGSWNTTAAANASGNLYICGTGGWPSTPSYTPYTYPHPIIAGEGTGSTGNLPNPPTNLAASVQ